MITIAILIVCILTLCFIILILADENVKTKIELEELKSNLRKLQKNLKDKK